MESRGSPRRSLRKAEAGSESILPLLQTQFAVSKVLASTDDPEAALPTIIATICINLGWELGAFWRYATNRPLLICTHISAADETLGKFIAESRKNDLLPGEGLPGRVFASSEPAWIADLTQEEEFVRNPAASEAGLQSAFAFPMLVGGDAIAVLEFFSAKFREPDYELLETMVALGRQVGQFIQRKEAEESLQQSFELYRDVTDCAADAIITVDESSTILLANRATEEIFGYASSELKGQSLLMLIPGDLRVKHEQALSSYLETGKRRMNWHSTELTAIHKDGHEVILDASFGEFTLNDQQIFTGFLRDITHRKKVEAALRSNERVTAMAQAMGGIAREIQAPLQALREIFQQLELSAPPEQMERLKMGQRELKKMDCTLGRAVGLVRATPAPARIELRALLDESLEVLSRKIQHKHISVQKRYQFHKPVMAHSGDLRQVFLNLIANALEAVRRNGHLWLRTYAAKSPSGSESVIILIADDGKGILPEGRDSLFQPFFSTKGKPDSGLGLWISSEILRKYGASIKVRSRTGNLRHGACFRVSFPVRPGISGDPG